MLIELILIGLVIFTLWNITKKPSNYPPGPWGYPIIGYIPNGKFGFEAKINQLRKEHGSIFCWKIGAKVLVFINDYKLIKEAFQNITFANRPDLIFLSFLEDKSLGIVSTNGPHWHELRRFSLRHLRDLGMGKSKIVSAIQFEVTELVNHIKKQAGKPAPFPNVLTMAVINVLWQMVASKRYDFDDENILAMHHDMGEAQRSLNRLAFLDMFPWIASVLPEALLNKITLKYKLKLVSDKMSERFQSYIDEHKKTLDENNPRDYIDEYLIEMKRQESQTDSTMSEIDLIGCVADLFAAGLETTSMTTIWAVFYLATFPEIQEKVHKEIDSILPNGTLVTIEDKSKLPYMEAFLTEVLRYSTLIPNGVPHTVLEDTKLGGYIIPKESIILTTTESFHFNPNYFESPEEFRPERFLTAEGKFSAPREGFFPFGIGKRQCLGESLARMELFIFLTSLAQNFSFSSPPGKNIDLIPSDIPIINQPKMEQDIVITVRK
ncbi:UNVERIFIED_CONTAM: hypothetical protein RMT77_007221 [Armadillidium vulgare]